MHPGLLPENAAKNRYDNILPSSAQIKLFPSEFELSETYINADLIEFPNQSFILTQAPLSNTIEAFWKMIWDYKVDQIVVLSQLEQGKCERYWPIKGKTASANLEISCLATRSPTKGLRCYQLGLRLGQEQRSLELWHDKRWPDFGVPDSVQVAFDLLSELWGSMIVIHCSAGVGRSGTLCLIKAAISLSYPLEKLPKLLAKIRSKRHGAVSNQKQYDYALQVLDFI